LLFQKAYFEIASAASPVKYAKSAHKHHLIFTAVSEVLLDGLLVRGPRQAADEDGEHLGLGLLCRLLSLLLLRLLSLLLGLLGGGLLGLLLLSDLGFLLLLLLLALLGGRGGLLSLLLLSVLGFLLLREVVS
jgi:hypothetical protein